MPYPYVMGEDKFGEITDTERKAVKDTDKLMSEMEVSLASNGDALDICCRKKIAYKHSSCTLFICFISSPSAHN